MATASRYLSQIAVRTAVEYAAESAAHRRGERGWVLTQVATHLERSSDEIRRRVLEPVSLRGVMTTEAQRAALACLQPPTDGSSLLVVATGPFIGEGFDCPVLDTLFLAAPIAFKGRLVTYAGRILRPHPGKSTADVYYYH